MADQVQNQSGGGEGEGVNPVEPIPVAEPAKTEVTKPEELKEEKEQVKVATPVIPEQIAVELTPSEAKPEGEVASPEQQDWYEKAELLKQLAGLQSLKKDKTDECLRLELKVKEDEIELLKAKVKHLETQLGAALAERSGKNHGMVENIKQQHEELLSKARGMIFDKTKMVKNQELQIEALSTQVQSLKDINQITKDLLEIRNSEVKAMEERYQAMDARFKAEKEKHSLVLQKAQNSSNINEDLRKEYETQLAIFKELRLKYDARVKGLTLENETLKASLANGSGPSA